MQVIRLPSLPSFIPTVSDLVASLYITCVDLSPQTEMRFGLQFAEWIETLKETGFGQDNIDQLTRLESLFAEYSQVSEQAKREQIKASINSVLAKMLRKAKRL